MRVCDVSHVGQSFRDSIEAAVKYKENPGEDFLHEALEAVDYLDKVG
jgi:hypothetical protein